jgi:4-amino-4-deoxy-L-arabinose transferase-like glycosyltransferase
MENSKPKVQSRKFRVGSLELEVFLVLALFILALLPRVLNLNAFITWDEPMWTYLSIKFLTALLRMDFHGTFLVGHPGVITTWAGATGISIQRLLGFGSAANLAWLDSLPTLDYWYPEALRKMAPFLTAAKLPLEVLNAACVVGIYLLARRLFDARIGLLATVLVALDPFHLALSRVLHTDALAANFMILSLLSVLVHLRQYRSHFYLLLSGVFAGLAFLSKSYALFLVPFTGLLLAVTYLAKACTEPSRSKPNPRQAIPLLLCSFALWCIVAVLVFFLLWPASWVDPLGTIQGVLDTASVYAAVPYDTSRFFMGKAVAEPGPWFYPVVLAFRTTLLTVFGLVVAILLLFSGQEHVKRENVKHETSKVQRGNLVAILAYACFFTILMTLWAKKYDRYILSSILALDIVAAWGLIRLGELTSWYLIRHFKDHQHWTLDIGYWILGIGLWILLFLFQTGHVLSYHPYYLAYYNPLLGGLSKAIQVLPVGWGEGMDLAARYLNQKENAADLRIATLGIPGFAPLFKGQTEALTEHNLAAADYAVLYVSDVQQDSPGTAALYGQQQPEHVVRIHNVDYAWIYPNTHYKELSAYLEIQAQPDDIVLLDDTSPFVKYYRGPLVYYVISNSQSWSEMTQRLAQSAGPQRLWYVAYPGSNMGNWIRYQLNTHARLIDQEALPHVTVSRYLLTSGLALESSPLKVQSNVNFDNRLRLTGYGFAEDAIEYRKPLEIALRWQTLAEMQEIYALSLRLVDQQGHFWGQTDEWLENEASLATYAWKAGEVSERHHTLSLLPGTPPGHYQVKMVLYCTDTLQRLDILDERGAPAGTEYTLGTVSVASPVIPPTIEELVIPHPLHHDFDGQVELLGYDLSTAEVKAGGTARVVLFWRALRSMESDYRLHLQVQDGEGHVWAAGVFPLANEEYPTNCWKEGEVIRGQYDLTVDAAAPTGEQTLNFKLQTSNLQPFGQAQGRPPTSNFQPLTKLSLVAPERKFTVPTDIQHPLRANLADQVAFLGYDLDKVTVKPGGTLHLTLYWQALARMETSYTVFVHLLDAQSRTWGQRDNLPAKGTHPTTSWLPGEVVIDRYEIAVDATAPAGEYQLEVGMYDLATMQRLPAFDEQGNSLPSDRILLSEVRVE